MPKVSVCIPVYDPGVFLSLAIESVLTQTLADFELVIVDDASTQPVEATVAHYRDSRIRFEKNLRNLGLVGNWNRCLSLAGAEYVTIFHQDDLMRLDNLAAKTHALDCQPSAGMVYSNIDCIDETGRVFAGHWIAQPDEDGLFTGSQVFGMVANTGNPISCPSVLARKECYRHLGTFDARLPFTADLEMWLRIAAAYDVAYLAAPLVRQRFHSTQETNRFGGSGRDYLDVLRALNIAFGRDIPEDCAAYRSMAFKTLGTQARNMARWSLRQGKVRASVRYLNVMARSLWQAR